MPVTIIGGHESWPPGRRLPRPGRLTIVYHPVIAPPEDPDVKGAARDRPARARGRGLRLPRTSAPRLPRRAPA